MTDPLELLRLTARLHEAGRDPALWPEAWRAVCGFFDCHQVFGDGDFAGAPLEGVFQQVARRAGEARVCVETGTGPCAGH